MDPDVFLDPVFQELLIKHERAGRKLRDAIIAMRGWFLKHDKSPQEETTNEKWRSALLSEEASALHLAVQDTAAELLRYGYELAPMSNSLAHMASLRVIRQEHRKRLAARDRWMGHRRTTQGIEEKVWVDGGPPLTVIIKAPGGGLTKRPRAKKPAISDNEPPAISDAEQPIDPLPPIG